MKDRSESEEDVISQQVEAISPGKLRELLRCREAEVVVRDELVSTNLMAKRLGGRRSLPWNGGCGMQTERRTWKVWPQLLLA